MSYPTTRSPNLIPRSPSPYGNPNIRAPSPTRAYSNPTLARSTSPNPYGRAPSPNPYGNPNISRSPGESTYRKPGGDGFEIERHQRSTPSDPDSDVARNLQASVDHLLLFKARPSAVTGTIPVEGITLFYRSKVSCLFLFFP
jgi:hypothetical protein